MILAKKQNEIELFINHMEGLSGAVWLKEKDEVLIEKAYGFADISNERKNNIDTRFGIASGAKLLTGISVCKLVDEGLVSFDSLLTDCLDIEFPNFSPDVTLHHLLTHTSGIPDYFDEETMDDFSELWITNPMYLLREPKNFIPMLQQGTMKFNPGETFSYNNGAFIILGLVIEHLSGLNFVDYVQKHIFDCLEMKDSGYFAFDHLPSNCAYGYIKNPDDTYKTNIYSLPVVGGPDGGVFITLGDMSKLWQGLFNFKLLSESITTQLLTPHVQAYPNVYYGYGIWMAQKENKIVKYYVTGSDPGVGFRSSIYPAQQIETTVITNKEFGAYDVSAFIESKFL